MSDRKEHTKKVCDDHGLDNKHLEQIVGGAETMSFEPGTLESDGSPSGVSLSEVSLVPGSTSKEASPLIIPLQTMSTSSLPLPPEL